jgi:hypothetical protein
MFFWVLLGIVLFDTYKFFMIEYQSLQVVVALVFLSSLPPLVIPAKAGIQGVNSGKNMMKKHWIPHQVRNDIQTI